ncbi:MAG: serine/threonine protein kinase [Planctomycetota bacterium]
MTDPQWEQLKGIVADALEREPAQRAAFLDSACGGDVELRHQADALLDIEEEAESYFEATTQSVAPVQKTDGVGRTLGRFTTRRVIASGGMGTIYEALQDHPRRQVALKVLRHGAASSTALRRFRHEAEILGRLRHPNIAQIHDAGTFDDGAGVQPYFAMELVKGRPLIEYCEAAELSTHDRLSLFTKVCNAVQYAHYQGVIHRDLKPDNILVDDFGEPKVLDFGVARATDADIQLTTVKTDIGQLIGTVPYMSPEQVTGDPTDVDTRSDVYSLGVVLYELLGGQLPHDLRGKSIPDAVRVIQESDPKPLSSISRVYRGDIDTIVSKALEKEKERRYQTAAELAADIGRYRADVPIVARPASTFYQLRKFARRNRALVGGVIGMFVLLVAGTTLSSIGFWQADKQRQTAESQADKAQRINDFLERLLVAANPYTGDREVTVAEVLEQARERIDAEFAAYPEVAARLHLLIGRSYRRLGKLPEAVAELRKAYEQSRDLLGHDDLQTLGALMMLADTLTKQGDSESIPLARLHLKHRRRLHGETDARTIDAMLVYGWALSWAMDDANVAEAEKVFRQARQMSIQVSGESHKKTVSITKALGNNLLHQYKLAQAEETLRSVLDWCEKRPGDDRTDQLQCAESMVDLSAVMAVQGRVEDGTLLAQEAHEILSDAFGPASHRSTTALRWLGHNLQWSGRLEDAGLRFQEYLTIAANANQPTQRAEFLLTRVQMFQGVLDAGQALPIFEDFVTAHTEPMRFVLGEIGLTSLARCLVHLGRFEEARQVMNRHPGRFMDAAPAYHYERRLYLETLIEMHEGLGEPEKAAEYRELLGEAAATNLPD